MRSIYSVPLLSVDSDNTVMTSKHAIMLCTDIKCMSLDHYALQKCNTGNNGNNRKKVVG